MQLKIIKMDKEMTTPFYARKGDAGLDLRSAEDCVIEAGAIKNIRTGIKMQIPENYVGLIWDKSGRAARDFWHCLAGVIDSGFRGELVVTLKNFKDEDFEIKKDMKIAQILIQKIENPEIIEVNTLEESERGGGMHGSTGDF